MAGITVARQERPASAVRVGQRRKSGLGQGHGKIGGHRRAKLKGDTGDWLLARLAEVP